MAANHLDNLSLASATHLHKEGHITLGQRDAIHQAVRRKSAPKMMKPQRAAGGFGSLAPAQSYGTMPMPMNPGAPNQAQEDYQS